jgi:electron transport complex protein RnfE
MNKYKKITLDGIIFNNPTFILVLGTCPTLGLISSALSALEMGLAVLVILTLSNMIISALRKVIPNEVRIPAYIVVIATLVTLIRMFLQKFLPDMYDALGGFLALIVVNCIILGRAEAFANKHTVVESAVDGIANGLGFTMALTLMGIFGIELFDFSIALFSKPAGTFIVFGLSIALFTFIIDKVNTSKRVKENKLSRENLLNSQNAAAQECATEVK